MIVHFKNLQFIRKLISKIYSIINILILIGFININLNLIKKIF